MNEVQVFAKIAVFLHIKSASLSLVLKPGLLMGCTHVKSQNSEEQGVGEQL